MVWSPFPSGSQTSSASPAQSPGAEACPVDHKTRQVWLDQAKSQSAAKAQAPPIPQTENCDSTRITQSPSQPAKTLPESTRFSLDQSREISTIPRAQILPTVTPSTTSMNSTSHGRPANNENESGASDSGNWIYPSEQMFFEAMRRKNYDPQTADMKTIVPIHNAVNERAWAEIKAWERGKGSEKCGGPKLISFSGQSTAMTPKARMNSLLGYAAPFDRHDWVVDRCGTPVDYVIDFYAGKDERKEGKSLNFYLDVRPKLNSVEGWKMRAEKILGL